MSQQETCLICFESFPLFVHSLSCMCFICPNCLFEWVKTTLTYNTADIQNVHIKCPNEGCKVKFPLGEIKEKLNSEYQEKIDDILLLKYLQNTQDVRNCPSSNCKYYGFIVEKLCDDYYQCLNCGELWENFQTVKRKRGAIFNRELYSTIYEEIFTKSCPNCGIFIYRTGGCLHMTCKKCEYEFCWTCKQNFKTHLGNICASNQFIRLFLLSLHILLALWKFEFLDKITLFFSFILHFVLKYVLFYNGFFALTVYFLHYLNNSYKYRYDVRRTQGVFGIYTVGALVVYCFLLLCVYGNFIEFFVFIITEIVILFVGVGIGFCFNLIWGRWLYNVE